MPTDTARKLQERNALVRRIISHGFELPEMDSCSNCVRRNVTCFSSPRDSKKCAECVRRKLKCDCMGPEHPDWIKLEREEERLDREEEETLAKLLRLRKQKRLIRTRGKEMLRRGLKTLDELDAAEEAERVAAEITAPNPSSAEQSSTDCFLPEVEPHFIDPDVFVGLPESFWADMGVAGRTLPTAQGS